MFIPSLRQQIFLSAQERQHVTAQITIHGEIKYSEQISVISLFTTDAIDALVLQTPFVLYKHE